MLKERKPEYIEPPIPVLLPDDLLDDLTPSGFKNQLFIWSYGVHAGQNRYSAVKFIPTGPGSEGMEESCIAVFPSEGEALRFTEHVTNPYPGGQAEELKLEDAIAITKMKGFKAIALVTGADPKKAEILWIN